MSDRARCRSCGEEIVWMKTESGKSIPVDRDSIQDHGAKVFDQDQMVSHFATCVDADRWRKNKKKKERPEVNRSSSRSPEHNSASSPSVNSSGSWGVHNV